MKSTNKVFRFMQKTAIITIVAVMGFAMMSCGDGAGGGGGGGGSSFGEFNSLVGSLTPGNIDPGVLEKVGLTDGDLDTITTGPGYKGWHYNGNEASPHLKLVWTNKAESNADSIFGNLNTLIVDYRASDHISGYSVNYGNNPWKKWWSWLYTVEGKAYDCDLAIVLSEGDYINSVYAPAGAMILEFHR